MLVLLFSSQCRKTGAPDTRKVAEAFEEVAKAFEKAVEETKVFEKIAEMLDAAAVAFEKQVELLKIRVATYNNEAIKGKDGVLMVYVVAVVNASTLAMRLSTETEGEMAKAFKKAAEMFSNMANTAESAFSTPEKEATAAEVAAEIAAEVASILKAVKKVMPRAE